MRRLAPLLLLVACSGGTTHTPTTTGHLEPPASPDAAVPLTNPPTGETLASAGLTTDWMDVRADPCDDFFQYACGGLLAQPIPADMPAWGAGMQGQREIEDFLHDVLESASKTESKDPVLAKLGDHYAACMDQDAVEKAGITPLAGYLATIAKVKDARSADKAIIALQDDGIDPFFAIGPSQDFADATKVIASLDQAGLGLPDRKYYLDDSGNMKDVRTAYQAHLGRLLALIDPKDADAAAADAYRIETALAKLQQDEVVRRDPHNVYHRIPLGKLPKGFPWKDYFVSFGLAKINQVTVNDPGYYKNVVALIAKEKPAALQHYLTARVAEAWQMRLGKAFVDEAFTMRKLLEGVEEQEPRWRQCVHRADADLGQLLAQPYVAAKFGGDAKDESTTLTHQLLGALDAELDLLPWMDDATRKAAHEKLGKMAALVGYPDTWRSYDFTISRTDFAGNVLAATKFEIKRQLAKIGKPVDRLDWGMNPQTVNAYYDPTMNELVLPAAILQPPYFGADFHPAVNFGGAGGVAGHEMTHGFDDEGAQFDGDGNLRDWWSKSTKEQFQAATQCVVDQYSQYDAVPGVKLDGKLTAGENIADIGGVKMGLAAYHAWRAAQSTPPPEIAGMTDDQAYYTGYAQGWCINERPELLEAGAHSDPHSPPRWRVNGVMIDQPGFAEAFHCKQGTAMAPAKSCAVW